MDHNRSVTSTDVVIILDLTVRGEWDTEADVSGDGKVTSLDVLMILQATAGAIYLQGGAMFVQQTPNVHGCARYSVGCGADRV